jgi:hypothetical protein
LGVFVVRDGPIQITWQTRRIGNVQLPTHMHDNLWRDVGRIGQKGAKKTYGTKVLTYLTYCAPL